MTGRFKVAAAGALMVAAMAAAGCKQPVRPAAPAAAPSSTAATSGVTPAPASGTLAGDATATSGGKSADFKAARREVKEACRDDLQACRAAGGDTKPMRCLRAKIDQLKPDCKAALQTMLAERRGGRAGRGAR